MSQEQVNEQQKTTANADSYSYVHTMTRMLVDKGQEGDVILMCLRLGQVKMVDRNKHR